jgi:hypothetical protein
MKGRYADERTLTVHRGEERKVDVSLRRTVRRYVAYGVLGLAGVFAVGGIYLASEAGRHNARAEELETKLMSPTGLTEAEGMELNESVDQSEIFTASAASTFTVSLIGVGIAAWLWFGDEPKAKVGPPALIAPRVGPGEAGASLTWRF